MQKENLSEDNIHKFIEAIDELPEDSKISSEIYSDSDIKIEITCENNDKNIIASILIYNPGIIVNDDMIGFPEKLSEIDNDVVKTIVKSFFREYKSEYPDTRRKSFMLDKYDWKTNIVKYKSEIIK